METKQLEFIAKEFIGKKCILRLTNGKLITGIMNSVEKNGATNTKELTVYCNNNSGTKIPLTELYALREF